MRKKNLLVECPRCGHQHMAERAGHWNDEDYLELFHELMDSHGRIKKLIWFMWVLMRARNSPDNPANGQEEKTAVK